jgi:hypothetical protein
MWMRSAIVVAVTACGLGACGDDGGGTVRTVTVTADAAQETPTSVPLSGLPVLIETRIPDARKHKGTVADGSVVAEEPFCEGGTTAGGSEGAVITTTFTCPGGTLKIRYAPTQRSLVQGADWEVVEGTGDYAGATGGGTMIAAFEEDDSGREVFTGELRR